jgi:NTP pyrophosphatase (non-canonical NTP hydrolase)
VSDDETTVLALREWVMKFVQDRAWEPFHNAKDLSVAIAIEAAELMEAFLWKSPDEVADALHDPELRREIEAELADVLILCLSLANRLQLDVTASVASKLAANESKYPADVVRGRPDKYTRYRADP